MKVKFKFKSLLFLILIPIGKILTVLCSKYPELTESLYSSGIYKFFAPLLSFVSAVLPFSLAEVIVIFLIVFLFYSLFQTLFIIIKNKGNRFTLIFKRIVSLSTALSILYFSFVLLWGLNYHRLPFADIAGLRIEKASVHDLKLLCKELTSRTNDLRARITEETNGTMLLTKQRSAVFRDAQTGFKNAAELYKELGGSYGNGKAVFLSNAMSYMGISGIYFPFTVEANVNNLIPDSSFPSTLCHEMAHQRGFAREDEANYIAYLTCTLNPDIEFQYSGMLLALIYSTNSLYKYDPEGYSEIYNEFSEGVKRDIKSISDFWRQYEGPVEKAQTKLNDAYLRANLQEDGVRSYGRMVDLLIAEYRQRQQLLAP